MTKVEKGLQKLEEQVGNFYESEVSQEKDKIYQDAYKIACVEEFANVLQNFNHVVCSKILWAIGADKISLDDIWEYYLTVDCSVFDTEEAILILEGFYKRASQCFASKE